MCLVPLKGLVPSIRARFGELSSPREIVGELAVGMTSVATCSGVYVWPAPCSRHNLCTVSDSSLAVFSGRRVACMMPRAAV